MTMTMRYQIVKRSSSWILKFCVCPHCVLWCYVRWRRVHWRPRTPTPFFLFWRRLNWRFVLCTTCIITACVWALYVLIEYSQTTCKLSELRHVHALGPKASGFVWLAKLFFTDPLSWEVRVALYFSNRVEPSVFPHPKHTIPHVHDQGNLWVGFREGFTSRFLYRWWLQLFAVTANESQRPLEVKC